jgi:DNA-binding transcriptional regulator YiaG
MSTADTGEHPGGEHTGGECRGDTHPEDAYHGDGAAPEVSERIGGVAVTGDAIVFDLADGRRVSVPLSWSWRLMEATPEERQRFEISPSGYSVHWPDVDEDLSARGALRGTPAPRPQSAPSPETPGEWTAPRIKQLRERLDLSQAELARRMGVRQATVSDWETGKQVASPMARRLLDRIAGAAGQDEMPA